MTVNELQVLLADLPGEREILMASDPEGNKFSFLESVNTDDDVYVEWEDRYVRGCILWP